MNLLVAVFEEKKRVVEVLESILDEEGIRRARRDHHARRQPRPCGITIHTGVGCSLGCIYCYVPDMGFPMKPRPYPLKPVELAYALAINPYVFPGYTLAAYGSVTEPFLPETRDKAIEYIRTVYRYLRLPSQVSTKIPLSRDTARKLREAEPRLSILLTIITIDEARRLEPNAPPPIRRLESVRALKKEGLHVALFIRPIIPGVTDREAEKIISYARDYGVDGVVLGSLRITPGILRRLSLAGLPVGDILRRLPRKPRSSRDQVTVNEHDVKAKIRALAEAYGVKVYPSACAANVEAHGEACNACRYGPCGVRGKLPLVKTGWVYDLLEYLGLRARDVSVTDEYVLIRGLKAGDRVKVDVLRHLIVAVARRRPRIAVVE